MWPGKQGSKKEGVEKRNIWAKRNPPQPIPERIQAATSIGQRSAVNRSVRVSSRDGREGLEGGGRWGEVLVLEVLGRGGCASDQRPVGLLLASRNGFPATVSARQVDALSVEVPLAIRSRRGKAVGQRAGILGPMTTLIPSHPPRKQHARLPVQSIVLVSQPINANT